MVVQSLLLQAWEGFEEGQLELAMPRLEHRTTKLELELVAVKLKAQDGSAAVVVDTSQSLHSLEFAKSIDCSYSS